MSAMGAVSTRALPVGSGRFSHAQIDAVACQRMWRALLGNQFRMASGELNPCGGTLLRQDQRAALDWFFTPDAAIVAMFCGLDVDVLRDRVRPLREEFRVKSASVGDWSDRYAIRLEAPLDRRVVYSGAGQ